MKDNYDATMANLKEKKGQLEDLITQSTQEM
jgi:hypothetical protein